VFVSVLDVSGAPLLGAVVADPPWNNFRHITGTKNEPFFDYGVKLAEIDLYKSSTQVKVIEYPEGNPVTSDQTPILSTNDEGIPIDWLLQAGYCANEGDCRTRVETNQLCRGHYSYWVVFQATHPF
jgi:hypothetical protein